MIINNDTLITDEVMDRLPGWHIIPDDCIRPIFKVKGWFFGLLAYSGKNLYRFHHILRFDIIRNDITTVGQLRKIIQDLTGVDMLQALCGEGNEEMAKGVCKDDVPVMIPDKLTPEQISDIVERYTKIRNLIMPVVNPEFQNIGRVIKDDYCDGYNGHDYGMYEAVIVAEGESWIVCKKKDGEIVFFDFQIFEWDRRADGYPIKKINLRTNPEKQQLIDKWCSNL
jgi:hypothetical protein